MRERTTWNRQEIANGASQGRTAEDPRAMNQDHLQQQPAADAYVTGGPSEFAEDVTPPNWKVEQAGGETKRNEIGMPEMLPETFKTAGLDEETLNKKAEVCIKVAREMLPTAAESAIEDQAYALMHLPDVELIETATRLAKGKVPPEFLEQQQKMKDKAKDGDDEDDAKKVAAALEAGDSDKAQEIIASMVQRQVQAAQQQKQQSEEEEDDAEAKQAAQKKQQQDQQQQDQEGQQGQGQQQKVEEDDEEDAAQQQQQQKQSFTIADQVQQMVQQAVQQQMPQQPMQQAGCGQAMSDDQMLDQMLQQEMGPDEQVMQGEPMDIQLEGAPMDIGEVQMGPEDAVLGQLFASNQEVQEAQQAEALRTGIPVQQQAPVTAAGTTRTAATRTVGTRPTGGVSQLGGAAAGGAPSEGNEIDKLSSMWKSAPDMSGVFNGE